MGVKTISLQEIRQLKSNANVKMINKYLPHKDYQLSIDSEEVWNKYVELLSTPGFLNPDTYYAIHRNPKKIIFARHNRLVSQYIIRYKP